MQNLAGSSSSTVIPWRRIWKLKVPTKLRHFIHRAASNVLPCRANLAKRGLQVPQECLLCGQQVDESQSHIFLQCNWSRAAWFQHPIGFRSHTVQQNFQCWVADLLSHTDEAHVAAVVQGMYSIWKARNNAYFNQTLADPAMVMGPGIHALEEWQQAQQVSAHTADHDIGVLRWKAPPPRLLKMNLDAGWTGNSSTGLGLVVRSSRGKLFCLQQSWR